MREDLEPLTAFEQLIQRQATDKEIQDLYRIKETLKIKDNDALWIVLCTLEAYNTLYRQYPKKIEEIFDKKLANFKKISIPQEPSESFSNAKIKPHDPINAYGTHIVFIIIFLILYASSFLSLGYLMATSASPDWYTSNNFFTNLLKTPIGLIISILFFLMSIAHLFLNNFKSISIKNFKKDFKIYLPSVIFLSLSVGTFILVL